MRSLHFVYMFTTCVLIGQLFVFVTHSALLIG